MGLHSNQLSSVDIPVIDLEQLRIGDQTELKALAYGLSELGLVHIKNHHLDPETLDQFYGAFDQFCRQPIKSKETLSLDNIWFQRGWTPPDTEKAVIAGGQPDFKECYFIAPEETSPELRTEYPQIFADNVWPEFQGGTAFKDSYLYVGRRLHQIGIELLDGVAKSLDLPVSTFSDFVSGGAHVTRALHYLPLNESQVGSDIRWGEEHTDFNLLTLLPGGRFCYDDGTSYESKGISGLYLRTRGNQEYPEGRRIRGSAPTGCIIAQVGQQLEILTGGRLLATPHEILPPHEARVHRSSMAHFIHAHPHQILTPLAPFRNPEAVSAYSPPVLAGNYSLKTLVDIGLAPASELNKLGYRHYRRLEDQRAVEQEM